jgi:hypothetical protein
MQRGETDRAFDQTSQAKNRGQNKLFVIGMVQQGAIQRISKRYCFVQLKRLRATLYMRAAREGRMGSERPDIRNSKAFQSANGFPAAGKNAGKIEKCMRPQPRNQSKRGLFGRAMIGSGNF